MKKMRDLKTGRILIDDLTGKQFGRLLVLRRVENTKHGAPQWLCKCSCGKSKKVTGSNLRNGNTNSCGCLKRELYSLPPTEASFNSLLATYKMIARDRNLIFELTEGEFRALTQQNCYYCGVEPAQEFKRSHRNGCFIYNGIDRLDNSLGYSPSNCVPCCRICNWMKVDMPVQDFLQHIKKIALIKFK